MLVVNLIGGAGSGKSTTRAGLFFFLKCLGIKAEEAIEFVKAKVYEENKYVFEDQLYILAKQNKVLKQLEGKVDVAIAECPLMLSSIYNPQSQSDTFHALVLEKFRSYDSFNILINRVKPFSKTGRLGEEEEARKIDSDTKRYLDINNIPYFVVNGDIEAPEKILELLIERGYIKKWLNNNI